MRIPAIILVLFFSAQLNAEGHIDQLQQEWNNSLQTWNKIKTQHPNYSYTTGFTSWVGYSNETTIKVQDGVVTARSFKEMQQQNQPGYANVGGNMYIEMGPNIGLNQKGAKPLTLDALYATCGADWLNQNVLDNRLYFKTDEQGLLKQCGYRDKRCADDCFKGVVIYSLELH